LKHYYSTTGNFTAHDDKHDREEKTTNANATHIDEQYSQKMILQVTVDMTYDIAGDS